MTESPTVEQHLKVQAKRQVLRQQNPDASPAPALPEIGDDPEEECLLAAFRQGDEAAFETLYRRHVNLLFGFAMRLAAKRSDAEDLTQEVFVRAWENRASFQSLSHLVHWLRRVTVNSWINRLRKRREFELPSDERGEILFEPEAPAACSPVARLDLEAALARLSPRLRAVAVLFDLYGFGHEEIAQFLDMTPGASKVQLHRARRRLRESLQ
ncbi:MAG: RNA polymerase sigma factor [Thermoanaerobaculia bacterium]